MNKRTFARIFALIMTLCMLCAVSATVVMAEEENTGSIMYSVDSSAEGAGVRLLTIGSVVDGVIVFDEAYSWIDAGKLVDGDADYYEEVAWKLQDQALASSSDAGLFERLNPEGVTVWNSVPLNKVYFVYQTDFFGSVLFQPSVFTCPMNMDGKNVNDVIIQSKAVSMGDKAYQGSVILNKIGYENRRLEDAQFTLWQKIYYVDDGALPKGSESGEDSSGKFYWKQIGGTLTTNENGQIMVESLPIGDYRFIETKAPDGYITDGTPHVFNVSAMGTVKTVNSVYVPDAGDVVELNIENKIDPDNPPAYYIEQESTVSEPEPDVSDIVLPDDNNPQLTSDDIKKYIIIGAIVGLSLAAIVVLFLIGGRKKKENDDKK